MILAALDKYWREAGTGLMLLGLAGVVLKILAGSAKNPRDLRDLIDTANVMLASRGYSIVAASQTTELEMSATRGACHVQLMEVRPQGWNTTRIETLNAGGGSVIYLYKGQVLETAPISAATWDYQLARILGQLHIPHHWEPVWAIVTTAQCRAEWLAPDAR